MMYDMMYDMYDMMYNNRYDVVVSIIESKHNNTTRKDGW